jgi:hypothetical protein
MASLGTHLDFQTHGLSWQQGRAFPVIVEAMELTSGVGLEYDSLKAVQGRLKKKKIQFHCYP